MITLKFAEGINNKSKNYYGFFLILIFLGIIINCAEPYPKFSILFPVLIIMFVSTFLLLKYCLRIMIEYRNQCDNLNIFNKASNTLLPEKKKNNIIAGYVFIIFLYFLCLYCLNFIDFNIMGIYILICGASILFMALNAYEIYIRLIVALREVSTDDKSLSQEYNIYFPSKTDWLQKIYQLSKVLKNASLTIGLLFVFENTMIFYANLEKINIYISDKNLSLWDKARNLPVEFWVIWLLVCFAIALAFPVLAFMQFASMKKIIFRLGSIYNAETTKKFTESTTEKSATDFYALMKTMQTVESTLTEKYIPPKFEKFIVMLASLVTSLLHLATLYDLFI